MEIHCPVCCVPVDSAKAFAVVTKVEGRAWQAYCCSMRCRVAYVMNPKMFADAAVARARR